MAKYLHFQITVEFLQQLFVVKSSLICGSYSKRTLIVGFRSREPDIPL